MPSSTSPFLQRGMARSQIPKAPVVNPYEKFTQPQFDAWIGDITGALRDALGYRAKTPPKPKTARQWHVPRRSASESAEENEQLDGRQSPKAKGKARDPREGPGLGGGGDRETPIEILDSDEEEEDEVAVEEEEEEEEEWDSEYSSESEGEEEQEALLNGESTVRAQARFQKYAARNGDLFSDEEDDEHPPSGDREGRVYSQEDYDNETGSESESDGGSSPPRQLNHDYDELEEEDEQDEMLERDQEVFNVDSEDDEPQVTPVNLDDDTLPASSSIQTSPLDQFSHSFSSPPPEVTGLGDEDNEEMVVDSTNTTQDWQNDDLFQDNYAENKTMLEGEAQLDQWLEEISSAPPTKDPPAELGLEDILETTRGPTELSEAFDAPTEDLFGDPNPHFPEHQVVLSTDEIVAEPSLVDLVNETRSPMQLSKAIDAPTEDLFGDLDPEPLHEQAQYPIILEADEIVDEHSHVDSVHENLHTTTVLTTEPLHEELRIVAKDLTGLAQGDLNYDPRQNSPSIVEQSSQDADPVVSQDIPVVPSVEESEQPALESINMAASEFQETAIAEVDELQPIVEGSNRVPGAAATVENVEEAETVKPIVPFIEHDETSDTMKPSVQPVEPPTEDAAVVVEETPLVQPSEAFLPSPILVNDSSESIPIKDDNTTLPISTDSPRKPGLFFPDYEGEEPLSDEEPIQSDGFFSGQQYYVIESDEVDQLEDDEYDVGQIDARTISRSVSIDPAHQHFIVEERLTEEPEQQDDDTGVDIVALDELEPILEETPIEMQAEEATIPPSWSPSLPVHVPMPVLADPMALDPSEPTSPDEAELASSPKISTPLPASLLRAKHVSSLFTPAGSMPGTPTELDVEQAQLQSPQAVIVEESPEDAQTEVIPDKSEFTAPAISASSNTESLPAEAEPTIQSSVDIPTTAPPLRRQPSAPSLQSDPYPYSLSTPGDILINSEIEGIADSGPSTATESEAMSGSEETASAVTSYEISELEAKELESGDNSLVQDTIPVDLDTEEQAVEPAPPVQDLATDMPKVDLAEPMAEVTPTPLSTAVPETDETDGDANVPEAKPAATDEQASPTTESESGSLKRKRDDAEDDTLPSTRPNFGKVARSRLSGRGKGKRKGKGREDDDTSSSSSSADSAARLLEEDLPLSSVVGTPSDGGSSFVLESSPTHSRGKVIKVIRSQRSQSELAPTPPPPPPPPPLPPVLMHAHSHNRRPALPPRQSTQPKPRPPPLQATPSRGSFTMPLSPSTPSDLTSSVMTPAPIRKPTAAPVTAGTPMTRAHCRYHKVSLPENAGDDDDDDRSGPRRTFVVPGCSLTDTDLMKEENILDEGNATDVDGERMVGNVEYLGLSAYLIGVLRHLVGVDIMREGEVYYLPKEDEEVKAVAVAPSPQVPGSSQPLTREKSKMRASMSLADLPLSPATSVSSSRPPHSVAGSSSTASVSLSRRKRGGKRNGGSPAPSQIFSQDGGSDDENQSPAAKKIRAAELEGIRAATENSPLRTRRGTKRVDSESADYAPEAEEELDDDDEDEVQTKKKRKRNGKGEERKSKKLKMRESIGPAQ